MKNSAFNIQHSALKMFACGIWCAISLAFSTSFTFIKSYEQKATLLTFDNFSNFYTVQDNRVNKFSPDGDFLYTFEEENYGHIGMIDASNPLKIQVFYPDFLTVITLDKFLARLTAYNFFSLGYQDIAAVASSSDGNLWFYDNIDFKLKKIDETGTVYQQSQPMNVILSAVPKPNFMVEKNNVLYINDPNLGILVFDVFGSYEKTIPIKGLERFQIFQDQILYLDSNKFNSYNFITLDVKSIPLPDSTGVIMASLQKDRLAILKKDRVDFYRY